jgi:hypothetical protein
LLTEVNGQPVTADNEPFADTIFDDGTFVAGHEKGIIAADGEFYTLASPVDSEDELLMYIGLKQSTGMSNAYLNGTYIMTTMGGSEAGGNVDDLWVDFVKITFDGAGTSLIIEVDQSAVNEEPGSYSVTSNGTFTLGEDSGIISANGNSFTMVGEDSDDNELIRYFGIKQH